MPAVAVPLIIFGVGTAINVIGQMKAGNAAKRLGDFNAGVFETQATDALVRGREDEAQQRLTTQGIISAQKAGFAGQNVDVGGGSALDVQADAAFLGELDALRVRTNAQREAWGYRQEAENARLGGANAQAASRWQAAGTVLGGAAAVEGVLAQRYGWNQPNTPRTASTSAPRSGGARDRYS